VSVGEIGLILVVASVGAVVLAMFYGVEEVKELEWKKSEATADVEEIRREEAEKARERIINLLNDEEGMK